jgi:hypothetical protein
MIARRTPTVTVTRQAANLSKLVDLLEGWDELQLEARIDGVDFMGYAVTQAGRNELETFLKDVVK